MIKYKSSLNQQTLSQMTSLPKIGHISTVAIVKTISMNVRDFDDRIVFTPDCESGMDIISQLKLKSMPGNQIRFNDIVAENVINGEVRATRTMDDTTFHDLLFVLVQNRYKLFLFCSNPKHIRKIYDNKADYA